MADFPPNLDDGEQWLPSDIFPDEVPSKLSTFYQSELTHLGNLAQHITVLALLQRRENQTIAKHPLNFAPNSQRFEPAVAYDSAGYIRAGHFGFNGSAGVGYVVDGYGSRGLWTGSRPAYQYHFVKPVQPQVGSFMEARARARARVLQKQQNQFLQNRVLPFWGSAVGGGFVRESGGTGVFLPRISSTTTTNVGRTRQSVTNRKAAQFIPQRNRNSMKRMVDEEKQEECHYQLPPEMGLPQDWTY